nr:hypothetical protein [Arthrobacter sp. IN13]
MSNNAALSPRREPSRIDTAVRRAMSHGLPAILLRMLSEAPGYAYDIALSLKLSPQTVERELARLAKQGLVLQVQDSGGNWFRLTNRHVAETVQSMSVPNQHRYRGADF